MWSESDDLDTLPLIPWLHDFRFHFKQSPPPGEFAEVMFPISQTRTQIYALKKTCTVAEAVRTAEVYLSQPAERGGYLVAALDAAPGKKRHYLLRKPTWVVAYREGSRLVIELNTPPVGEESDKAFLVSSTACGGA